MSSIQIKKSHTKRCNGAGCSGFSCKKVSFSSIFVSFQGKLHLTHLFAALYVSVWQHSLDMG